MKILLNQIGYVSSEIKRVVVQLENGEEAGCFEIISPSSGTVLYSGMLERVGSVARWNKGEYAVGFFSDFTVPGEYKMRVSGVTERFVVTEYLTTLRLISANTSFFKAQRSSGEWDEEDKHLSFLGPRKGEMDIHGGWFDASGDHGIHLSHLSHSTWYNPQQMGFSVYAFFLGYDWVEKKTSPSYAILKKRMLDEGSWGADFLMRCHIPGRAFIRSIRRNEDLDHMEIVKGTRAIGFDYHGSSDQFSEAVTALSERIDDTYYETSLRSGGALASAALAEASVHDTISPDYSSMDYLSAAEESYMWMRDNNEKYTNDGKWNFVDYYTSLIASVSLYKATRKEEYLFDARMWFEKMAASSEETADGGRRFLFKKAMPFHHASDEGMPVMAILLYRSVESDEERRRKALETAESVMRHKIFISRSVTNPFFYPMEEVGDSVQFFFPHETTVSPWWQGENARLGSIAASAMMLVDETADECLKNDLSLLSSSSLDWIMGLNPFDSSMVEGFGRNNPQYFFFNNYDYMNIPGGIVNGITSGIDDEEGIELVSSPTPTVSDNWRWAEQWLPHVSWFMLAECMKKE
ncbi:MAG: glycoside hydrolase family 9 protein [Candidatus Ornithospirochaeta sp.]